MQVISLAGELLGNAESLLRDGLHTAEIADGYAKAGAKVRNAAHTKLVTPTHSSLQAVQAVMLA